MQSGKRYHIVTFGCQMNESDTEVLDGILESLGYEPAVTKEEADLLVLVTCAVRKKAEDKVAAFLGRLRRWKEEKRGRILAVGGCMSQQEEMASYIKKNFRHVDIIFGTDSLYRFPQLMEETMESRKTVVDIDIQEGVKREGQPVNRKSSFHAWVPIIYGCNNFCSYCIVPYVRGREKSRTFEDVVEEVKALGNKGYREVTLLGQNVDAYGKDLPDNVNLASLMEELNRVEGIQRLRFLTSHPRDFNENIIKAVSGLSKVCEHVHLPLQAGSNRILKKMNRGYTRQHYLGLIDLIRNYVEGVAITTDIIVGYPGETKEEFEETMELVERIRFDAAYTFVYSPRQGTPAAREKDNIPKEVKKERIQKLIERQKEIGLEINRQLEGQLVEVLVEGISRENSSMLTGRTRTNKLAHFPGSPGLEGEAAHIRIKEAKTWHLQGELEYTKGQKLKAGVLE